MPATQTSKSLSNETIAEPDVWWGPDGIDALIWADGIPYAEPTSDSAAIEPSNGDRPARDVVGAFR